MNRPLDNTQRYKTMSTQQTYSNVFSGLYSAAIEQGVLPAIVQYLKEQKGLSITTEELRDNALQLPASTTSKGSVKRPSGKKVNNYVANEPENGCIWQLTNGDYRGYFCNSKRYKDANGQEYPFCSQHVHTKKAQEKLQELGYSVPEPKNTSSSSGGKGKGKAKTPIGNALKPANTSQDTKNLQSYALMSLDEGVIEAMRSKKGDDSLLRKAFVYDDLIFYKEQDGHGVLLYALHDGDERIREPTEEDKQKARKAGLTVNEDGNGGEQEPKPLPTPPSVQQQVPPQMPPLSNTQQASSVQQQTPPQVSNTQQGIPQIPGSTLPPLQTPNNLPGLQ